MSSNRPPDHTMRVARIPRYAVIEETSRKAFLNIHDALGIDRLLIEIVTYDADTRTRTAECQFYLGIGDARLLAHAVVHRWYRDTANWAVERFGGSERDGVIESRRFRMEYDPGPTGAFSKLPYRITIVKGPGRKTASGGIEPLPKAARAAARNQGKRMAAEIQCSFRLAEEDACRIMLEVQAYLAAHQWEIERLRYREQLLAWERRGGQLTPTERQRLIELPRAAQAVLPASIPMPDGQGSYAAGTALADLDPYTLQRIARLANTPYLREAATVLLGSFVQSERTAY